MVEITCEVRDLCNRNEQTFKGLLASDLASATLLAPYTAQEILPKLQGSAVGAAKQCIGGVDQNVCGQKWYPSAWDGSADLETQMSATSLFTANLGAFSDGEIQTAVASDQNTSGSETQAGTSSSSSDSGSSSATTTAATDKPNQAGTISISVRLVLAVSAIGSLLV